MDIWKVLGIAETKDKGLIKQVYRARLNGVNPEDDAEGFMELRTAYEKALSECDKEEEVAEAPSGELTQKLKQLYMDYPNRIRLEAWLELFQEEMFVSLDTETEALEELLVFLMDNFRLPCKIWQAIVEGFDLQNRKEWMQELFPSDFITFVFASAEKKRDVFEYRFLTGDYTYADAFINTYMQMDKSVSDEEKRARLRKELSKLREMPLYHPYLDVSEIYIRLQESMTEEAYADILRQLNTLDQEYPDDCFILIAKVETFYRWKHYEEAKQTIEEIFAIDAENYDAWCALGDTYTAMGELEKAKETYETMFRMNYRDSYVVNSLQKVNHLIIEKLQLEVKQDAGNHEKLQELAWCYYQNQREDDAITVLDTFTPEQEECYQYYNVKGRCYLVLKQYEDALSMFFAWKEAIEAMEPVQGEYTEEQQKRRKRYPYVHTLIAAAYNGLKEYSKAREYIELPVQTEHEERLTALNENLQILYNMEDYEACFRACEDMLSDTRYAQEYWAHCYRAKACYMLDYLQECIYSSQNAIRIFPYDVEPYIEEIKTFQQVGQYEDAEDVINSFRQFYPDSDSMKYYEAVNLHQQKQTEKAIGILEELEKTYHAPESDLPDYIEVLLYLADLYDITDKDSEAIAVYKKVEQLAPDNMDVHSYLGYMYRKVNECGKAIEEYEKQISVWAHPVHYNNLAGLYQRLCRFELAYQCLEQVIKLTTGTSERETKRKTAAIRKMSQILYCQGKYEEATRMLEEALDMYGDTQDPELRIELGLGLGRANRYTEAKQVLLDYVEHGEDVGQQFRCASLAMELAGEEDDMEFADVMYKKALELNPEDTSIYSKYGRILVMNGRYAEAVEAYQKAVEAENYRNYYPELINAIKLRDGEIKKEYQTYLEKAFIPEEERTYPREYVSVAIYYRVTGDYAKAEACLLHAIDMPMCYGCGYNGCDDGYYELGILYEEMEEFEKAIDAYEKTIAAHGHCYVYERDFARVKEKLASKLKDKK